jgi:hypothetical protein
LLLGALALPRRRFAQCPRQAPRGVALVLAFLTLAPTLAFAETRNVYLEAAMKLYRDLEYESALEDLKLAVQHSNNAVAERRQIALYTGLIEFELGHADEADRAFKQALALGGKLELPGKLSPKVTAAFERARAALTKTSSHRDAAEPQASTEGVADETETEAEERSLGFQADLRVEGQPGKGLGFEVGAGVSGNNYAFTVNGIIGHYFGLGLRSALVFPKLAAGFGVYGSLDVPVMFFATDSSDGSKGGVMFGGGLTLGARYEVMAWLWPFLEVSGRYYFVRPDSTADMAPWTVLVAGGVAFRVP